MYALETENLYKTYTNGVEALKNVSLTVEQGDFFALLGPNGAGKSTTIGIITSLVRKTSGLVKIFDIDIDKNFSKAKSLLGVVPQEYNFHHFRKVRDILTSQAGYYGIPYHDAKKRADKYLALSGLTAKANETIGTLSGGQKRRVMIARALIHEPKMLILDEPTAGVDIEIRRTMWDFLEELNANGTTVILTTHYLEEAEHLCRSIAIINHGTVVENTTLPALLRQLESEHFILYIDKNTETLPSWEHYTIKAGNDACELDVEVGKGGTLTELISLLAKSGITVNSMRNKANRLEEMFLRLTQKEANPNES
jgi:ABC-2 type transport system ATP-binding protein